ncbi:hypothetical protein CABS01_17113 [Colletotrichum abscissum]|uniref:uncharacterized protein n=1 Tax=Colletotrichum abscissum TaxID=1671311 RepID=UPI0027D499D0|nr:uncharacterized protein CABS01_17113 [Colletotrichum abscissum]KAK1491987.1 hypothetical protein CABS01_17113 [Colletotrichum abscissum]
MLTATITLTLAALTMLTCFPSTTIRSLEFALSPHFVSNSKEVSEIRRRPTRNRLSQDSRRAGPGPPIVRKLRKTRRNLLQLVSIWLGNQRKQGSQR